MKFRITGADSENGDVVEVTVTAPTSAAACEKARALGVVALSVEDAGVEANTSVTPGPPQPIVVISPDATDTRAGMADHNQPAGARRYSQHRHARGRKFNMLMRGERLGVAAISLGIVGLLMCWVPFASRMSLPLSVAGVALGGIGVIRASRRDDSPAGIPIAGAAVSVLAGIVAVVTGALPMTALRASETPEDTSITAAASVAVGEAINLGEITLTLDAVHVGRLTLRSAYSDRITPTDTDFLIVRISVTNASASRRFGPISASGILADSHNNTYKEVSPYSRFGHSTRVDGLPLSSDAVYPGQTVGQWIIFDRPVDETSALRLSLSVFERASMLQTNELANVRWRLPAPSHE
jgi:hypothetical protein